MSDDKDQDRVPLGELKRLNESEEQRGYPSYWHADKCSQTWMEIDATRTWAGEMNKQGRAIDACSIAKNCKDFPDCIADEDGRRIGVEVTEFTVDPKDREKYVARKKAGLTNVLWASGVARDGETDARVAVQRPPKTSVPNAAEWPLDDFRSKLERVVRKKDGTAEGHKQRGAFDPSDFAELVLLIVTDEPNLWPERLGGYLRDVELPRPRYFRNVYVMMGYQPDGLGDGSHYPLFEEL